MNLWLRSLAAVVMGLVVAFAIQFAVEWINMRYYPYPAGINFGDPAAIRAAKAALPRAALAIVLAGWFVSTVAAAWISARIARGDGRPPLITGILLLGSAVGTMVTVPHPAWFWVLGVAIYPVAIWIGSRMGGVPVRRTA